MTSKKTIEKSKLIQLLSSFSTLEWKRFGRFVQSPYHNTNRPIISLYTILKKAFPFDRINELEQERLHKKIYGRESFNLAKFQNLCSDLYELATDFIVDIHLSQEKRQKKKLIVAALAPRNYDLFKGASQQLIKEVETQEYLLDGDDFLLLYQLNGGLHYHIENDKFVVKQKYSDKAIENLRAFYEDTSTQLLAENKSVRNFLNKTIEIEEPKKGKLKQLFQLAIDLHHLKQTELYFQLKSEVLHYWAKLKQNHKTNLFIHLLNFSFTNNLIQKKFGYKESFDLYKIGVKDQLFIFNKKMRAIDFINISTLGFGCNENDWTQQFIENHKMYLKGEDRSFFVPLAYAYQANIQKKYKKVIELLSQLNPKNQLRDLSKVKSLLIRAYFEGLISGEDHYRQSLNYEMESFKKMMTRNTKLSAIKTEAYLNFLKLLKRLIQINDTMPNHLKEIQAFEEQLEKIAPLVLKDWLVERLDVFKNTAP